MAFVAAIVAETSGLALAVCVVAAVAGGFARFRIAAVFGLAGIVCGALYGHPVQIERESRVARFSATVVGDVRKDELGLSSFVAALDSGVSVVVRVRAGAAPGERLVVRGRLVPFDEARNPGEPSRRAIALGEGLAGQLDGDRIVARAGVDPFVARAWAARARATLAERLRERIREPEATVLAGALWGERGTLPHDLRDDFQATGTVHVLVTAGLHLGAIAALLAALLGWLRVPRVWASLGAIPCVVAYAWLSGAHLPSQRAAVMVSVALLARACGARVLSWNALALAALVVAALRPASVSTVSFALSFSCVVAIGLFARPIAHALERYPAPERVRDALALTIATQLGVWPLSAATFGLIAPYAVVANAIVVPAVGVAMFAGIATLALASAPFAATLGAQFAGALSARFAVLVVDLILHTVTVVAAVPGARLAVAPPPGLAIVGYDIAAIVAATLLRRDARLAVCLLVLATGGVFATTLRLPNGRLTITMLDVGQGDGIVVRTPRGHTIVIDSGGRLERGPGAGGESPAELVGERIVLAYLRRTGVRRVDLLLNTHPHGDHVGGFAPIVRALRVDAIADSGQQYGGRAFNDGMREAARHHVPVHTARCGDGWRTDDGVTLSVLSPCGTLFVDGNNDVNENSVVVMLVYRDFRMLFMGDAGFQAEQRILGSGVDVHADVLKVGHHGSAYSSSPNFVAAVRPKYALISVGRHNLFGHPAATTLATLRNAAAMAYRTDLCGAITVEAGKDVPVSTSLRCSDPAMVLDRI